MRKLRIVGIFLMIIGGFPLNFGAAVIGKAKQLHLPPPPSIFAIFMSVRIFILHTGFCCLVASISNKKEKL